ncbi:unnamed protein product [Rotaria magnacalcarata]|uniref:Uncharacterized protein n=1 Tax=Rotaria magnacalcarata TaxID=392030 RepID=A0A8S3JQ98_9BILA|nr:unnamed protein product [Rotaria magnacalcarata]
MTLFAVPLNCHNADGAFDLFEEIMNVYADPYNGQSAQILSSLLSKSHDYEFPVEQYLDDYENDDDTPHFLDEIDITTDAIIHLSPFNVKAYDRIPSLKELIHKEPLEIKPTNPLFATKIYSCFINGLLIFLYGQVSWQNSLRGKFHFHLSKLLYR